MHADAVSRVTWSILIHSPGRFWTSNALDAEARRGALSLEYLRPAADSARRLRVAGWRLGGESAWNRHSNPIWREFVGPSRWNHHKSAIWSDKSQPLLAQNRSLGPANRGPRSNSGIPYAFVLDWMGREMSRCQWCRFCWRKIWRDLCLLMLIFFHPSITLGWCKKKDEFFIRTSQSRLGFATKIGIPGIGTAMGLWVRQPALTGGAAAELKEIGRHPNWHMEVS